MADWKRLSADTKETCDTVTLVEPLGPFAIGETFGWNPNPGAKGRCGKKAEWIHRSRCGCGECDMSARECDEHYQKRTKEKDEQKSQSSQKETR